MSYEDIKNRKKISVLRKELQPIKKRLKYAETKRHEFYEIANKLNNVIQEKEKEIRKLQHKYYKGDIVLLKQEYSNSDKLSFSVAEIRKLIGAKKYKVFEYFPNGRVGTTPIISEDRIVCPIQSILGLAKYEVIIKEREELEEAKK